MQPGTTFLSGKWITTNAAECIGMRGSRIAYVAQSAAALFNPAHKIIDQHTERPLQYRLQKTLGPAYMFITHDLATVRSIAGEVVAMQHGQVVERGPKDEMFRPPHHPFTDLLPSFVPEMDPNWLTTLIEECGVDNIGEAAKT